jgi:hypothetical protein
MHGVIAIGILGLRMDEDAQPGAVEHEKRHEAGKFLDRKRDLIHRDRMRADRLVMPAPQHGGEALANLFAQSLGTSATLQVMRIVIDMGVIALNARWVLEGHGAMIVETRRRKKGCAAPLLASASPAMKDRLRALATAAVALALASCSALPAPYQTYAPADTPAPIRPQNPLVVYGTTTTSPENVVDLGIADTATPSPFTPPAATTTPPAAQADKTRRIAICYSRLWNSADAVRSAAALACGNKTSPRVVDQGVDLDACPLLTPTHAVFACSASP